MSAANQSISPWQITYLAPSASAGTAPMPRPLPRPRAEERRLRAPEPPWPPVKRSRVGTAGGRAELPAAEAICATPPPPKSPVAGVRGDVSES